MSNSFIVVFKENTSAKEIDSLITKITNLGATLHHKYDSVLLGFSASNLSEEALKLIKSNPSFDYLEQDQVFKIQ